MSGGSRQNDAKWRKTSWNVEFCLDVSACECFSSLELRCWDNRVRDDILSLENIEKDLKIDRKLVVPEFGCVSIRD